MTEVTRGEFEMLRQAIADNSHRLDSIDASGTRGVGIVQVQLTDLAKDVSALSARLDKHDQEHEQETRARQSRTRWLIGTGIAFLAMIEGPLLYLVSQHLR